MMQIDVITIFPKMFEPVLNVSIIKRAVNKRIVSIKVHDLRRFTKDKHKKVDDRPFGGGPGMVLSPQPLFDAIKKIKGRRRLKVLLMCPTGMPLNQKLAKQLSKNKSMIIVCGHYEGVDERVRSKIIDQSISIGDYVLTGGELPAMVLIDTLIRLIPGVLGKVESLRDESFEQNLLDFPQYTRPANFRGIKVPDVLLSGNHKAVKQWRKQQSIVLTKKNRPDLAKD